MPELRKRKDPPPAPAPAAKKERKPSTKKAANGDAEAVDTKVETPAEVPSKKQTSGPPKVGDAIDLTGFGGEVETHDEKKVTLKQLVDDSKAGVVLFTYPKASTPGCTTQVCLFRDSYDPLTATGLSIYGLSRDSAKSNTNFKTKQSLPYSLLCDKAGTLVSAIGLKDGDKTRRGVFVVTKDGKVLAAEPGGPAATVDVVKKIVAEMGGASGEDEKKLEKAEERVEAEGNGEATDDQKKTADVAGEVADTAAKLDK